MSKSKAQKLCRHPGSAQSYAGARRASGFRITIFDERTRGDSSKPRLERVVVAGE